MEIRAIKTWHDTHHGMVSITDDVLSIVQRIREIDSRLKVYYNEQRDEYNIVETSLDGVDRLVFTVETLDARVISRLLECDQWNPDNPDVLDKIDKHNEGVQADIDQANREKIDEVGERLAWALEEDGKGTHASILIPRRLSS